MPKTAALVLIVLLIVIFTLYACSADNSANAFENKDFLKSIQAELKSELIYNEFFDEKLPLDIFAEKLTELRYTYHPQFDDYPTKIFEYTVYLLEDGDDIYKCVAFVGIMYYESMVDIDVVIENIVLIQD